MSAIKTSVEKSKRDLVIVAFGAAVRKEREALPYSQEAFADACGLDRSYMGGVERGARNLGFLNVWLIISTLGKQPSDFFLHLDNYHNVSNSSTT